MIEIPAIWDSVPLSSLQSSTRHSPGAEPLPIWPHWSSRARCVSCGRQETVEVASGIWQCQSEGCEMQGRYQ